MKLSIAVSAAFALIAVLATAAATAAAPIGNFITQHLGPNVGQFRGAVKSDVLECIANRKVRIVLIQGPFVGPDMRVGKGFTDDRGHFNIQTTQSSGTWIAKVKREEVRPGLVCDGAISKRRAAG